ncbi:molecular chaperone TorD [Neptunomonas sp. XY-337]|uniref:molecular chaperone TorD n=1 Tax=Neptunomonas sp. XY-337 TaxID=2561897 RepID=UPI0010AAA336|nr:molecular chaperone TorD [Neptunomonas sp. XY-337]
MGKEKRREEVIAISAQDAEARASVYWWLATVYAQEIKRESLRHYFSAEGQAFLTSLREGGRSEEGTLAVDKLRCSIKRLQQLEFPELELAADFTQTFLGDIRTSAPPYASVYLSADGLLFQQPHDEMLALLKAEGLVVNTDFNEPADHLAIMLDFMGNQVLRVIEAESEEQCQEQYRRQLAFLEQKIMTWMVPFRQQCERVPGCGFYPAITEYLVSFIKAEQVYLHELLVH